MIVYAPPARAASKLAAREAAASAQAQKAHRAADRSTKTANADRDASRCHGRAICERRILRAADGRLRRAYAQAVRARAPRAVLLRYRSDWAQLRRQQVRRPEETAAAYDQLAREISRQARRSPRGRR